MCKKDSISRILYQHASISRFFVNENMVSFLGFWYVNKLLFLDTKGFRGRRQSGGVGRRGWSVQTVWTVWTAPTPPSLLLADAPWDIRWEADFDLKLQLGTHYHCLSGNIGNNLIKISPLSCSPFVFVARERI